MDEELKAIMAGACYIYSKDGKTAMVIMEVPEEEQNNVNNYLKKTGKGISGTDEDRLERIYRGFKAHVKQ